MTSVSSAHGGGTIEPRPIKKKTQQQFITTAERKEYSKKKKKDEIKKDTSLLFGSEHLCVSASLRYIRVVCRELKEKE